MYTKIDQTLPIEIWADMLEDAGVNTGELRAWLTMGLGIGNGNWCGYRNEYGDGFDSNYISEDKIQYGHGYTYGYTVAFGNGYGFDAHGNGYAHGTQNAYGNANT